MQIFGQLPFFLFSDDKALQKLISIVLTQQNKNFFLGVTFRDFIHGNNDFFPENIIVNKSTHKAKTSRHQFALVTARITQTAMLYHPTPVGLNLLTGGRDRRLKTRCRRDNEFFFLKRMK